MIQLFTVSVDERFKARLIERFKVRLLKYVELLHNTSHDIMIQAIR